MATKVIGLIQIQDPEAFEEYRTQVGDTVALYQGKINSRGAFDTFLWNELHCEPFNAMVELEFPDLEHAQSWAHSTEYQSLLAIRSKAMRLTLFTASI